MESSHVCRSKIRGLLPVCCISSHKLTSDMTTTSWTTMVVVLYSVTELQQYSVDGTTKAVYPLGTTCVQEESVVLKLPY